MTNLGYLFDSGEGLPPDAQAAVEWYRRAAAAGDATGQYNLALKLETGDGVTKDVRRAVHWYRRAALQGERDAQRRLGELYVGGTGIEANPPLALAWFRLAGETKTAEIRALEGRLSEDELREAEERLTTLRAKLAR